MKKIWIRDLYELSSADYRKKLEKAFGREVYEKDLPTVQDVLEWQERQVNWL